MCGASLLARQKGGECMKFYYETKSFKGFVWAKDDETAENKISERHGTEEGRDIYVLREATESDKKEVRL